LFTSNAAITNGTRWPDWQISSQRIRIENSSRECVVCGS
jgi:hypothetical protein